MLCSFASYLFSPFVSFVLLLSSNLISSCSIVSKANLYTGLLCCFCFLKRSLLLASEALCLLFNGWVIFTSAFTFSVLFFVSSKDDPKDLSLELTSAGAKLCCWRSVELSWNDDLGAFFMEELSLSTKKPLRIPLVAMTTPQSFAVRRAGCMACPSPPVVSGKSHEEESLAVNIDLFFPNSSGVWDYGGKSQ